MKPKAALAIAVAGVAVVAGALSLPKQQPTELTGKAPLFSAPMADGKTTDLATLTKDGPVYLYFVKKDCPVNAKAVSLFNDIYKAYSGKANIVAIFNGDADELKAYESDHPMSIPIVMDPKQEIVSKYLVERSPWMIEVQQDGTVGKIWKGYSQQFLGEINDAVAAASKQEPAKVSFKDAPKAPRYG